MFASCPASEQVAERPEVQVQVLRVKAELCAQLLHPLVQLHERPPQAFLLIRRKRSAVDAAQRLALHELAQQLDDREYELREPALELLGVGVHTPRQRVVEPRG